MGNIIIQYNSTYVIKPLKLNENRVIVSFNKGETFFNAWVEEKGEYTIRSNEDRNGDVTIRRIAKLQPQTMLFGFLQAIYFRWLF